jgi:hypothetical protein
MVAGNNGKPAPPREASIVELRKNLKLYLSSEAPTRVERHGRVCALLVPIDLGWWMDEKEQDRRICRALSLFRDAVKSLRERA